MKTMIVVLLAALVLVTGCAPIIVCGSGHVVTQDRRVGNFNAVSLAGGGDVIVVQGETEALTIEAEDNLLPYIKTGVKGGTLTISGESGPILFLPTEPIRYNLTVKDLSSVDLSGWGNIRSASLKTDQLHITHSGAGYVMLDHVEATNLTSTVRGVGGLTVSGQVTNQTAHLSGPGYYEAADLSSQSAHIDDDGPGNATVWARESLDVTIGGPGNINYYGSPRVQQNKSGMGKLTGLGNK